MFNPGRENYITEEEAKNIKVRELYQYPEELFQDPSIAEEDMIICELITKIEDNVIYPLTEFVEANMYLQDDDVLWVQLEMRHARKYYGDLIELSKLHEALRDVAAERNYSVESSDDEPAFYMTTISFPIIVESLDNTLENAFKITKEIASDLYTSARKKAIQNMISLLDEELDELA